MSLIVVKKQHVVKPPLHVELDLSLPLFRGLVGAWTFQEGCGNTLFDRSGFGNHGTINGATWTMGEKGWALNFDGTDDRVECPGIDHATGLTVAVWAHWKGGSSNQSAMGSRISGKTTASFYLHFYHSSTSYADIAWWGADDSGTVDRATIGQSFPTTGFHWLVGVVDDSYVCCFFDGEQRDVVARTHPFPPSGSVLNIFVGCSWYDDGFVDFSKAIIACAFFWNRALTADEVRELYEMML